MSNHPASDPALLPNVLLDAVGFGIGTMIAGIDLNAFVAALAPWADRPECQRRAQVTKAMNEGLTLSLAVKTPNGIVATVEGRIVIAELPGGIRITERSGLRINPMRGLASILPGPQITTLDNKGNAIGPHPVDVRPLLARQLALIEHGVESFVDLLSIAAKQAAGPDGYDVHDESLWLRSAELCRDIGMTGAVAAVRRLQTSGMAGSTIRAVDSYRCSSDDNHGVPALRWWRTRRGPVVKAYAKAADLLRIEVACPDREAVRVLMPECATGDIDGRVAVDQVLAFAGAASPLLSDAVCHVDTVLADGRSPADLVLALLPLIDLAAGRRSSGRGPAPGIQTRVTAQEMLDQLLQTGEAWATGIDKKSAVRVVLDALAGPDGPLYRSGHWAHYIAQPLPPAAESDR